MPKKKQSKKIHGKPVKPSVAERSEIYFNEIILGTIKIDCRKLWLLSLFITGIFLLWGSLSIEVASDEPIDYSYGDSCLHYFTSFGKDTSFENLKWGITKYPDQKYYGAAFEMVAPAINAVMKPQNPYTTHHILCALAGILLILFTSLCAQQLKGWRVAVIALWLMLLCPVISGNSFFNSKDVPLAAAFASWMFFLLRFVQSFPVQKRSIITGLLLSVAAAVSIRISGLLLVGYTIAFLFLWWWFYFRKQKSVSSSQSLGSIAKTIMIIIPAGCLIGFITYPNFWHEGMHHITEGISITKKFPHSIDILFKGKIIPSQKIDVPQYLLRFVWMTVPEILIIGFIAGLVLFILKRKNFKPVFNSWMVMAAIFPFAFVMVTKAPIYNGWRQLMFAFPFITVIASLGWNELLILKQRYFSYAAAILLIAGFIQLTIWQVQAFPYNYIYFNGISGGVSHAYQEYDLDYQQLASSACARKLWKDASASCKPCTVFTNNGFTLRPMYDSTVLRYKQAAIKTMWLFHWEYAVMSPVFIDKPILKFTYPPYGTVWSVNRFGVPLACLVKRTSFEEVRTFQLMNEDSFETAEPLVEKILATNKTIPQALYWKAWLLHEHDQFTESLRWTRRLDSIFPDQPEAIQLFAFNYFNLKKYDSALYNLQKIYVLDPGNPTYNLMIGKCYQNLGNDAEAAKYFSKSK